MIRRYRDRYRYRYRTAAYRAPSVRGPLTPAGGPSPCHPDRAKRVEGSVKSALERIAVFPKDPSTLSLRSVARDDTSNGLSRPARRHVVSV